MKLGNKYMAWKKIISVKMNMEINTNIKNKVLK